MDDLGHIAQALERALARMTGGQCPPRLARALRHAVLSGGARMRPRLLAAVARAAGGASQELVDDAGAAIELLHCASLVHDDLPCFDDAPMRRGVPSVHAAFGEATAVLCGDGLIFESFNLLAGVGARAPQLGAALVGILAQAAGAPRGLTAGQAWEVEPQVDLAIYHQAKTAALFEAATMAGALLAGAEPGPWRLLGTRLGQAYQVLDDLRDVDQGGAPLGKPRGRDAMLGRPNAALLLGTTAAVERFFQCSQAARDAIPACTDAAGLLRFLDQLLETLRPGAVGAAAAGAPPTRGDSP